MKETCLVLVLVLVPVLVDIAKFLFHVTYMAQQVKVLFWYVVVAVVVRYSR